MSDHYAWLPELMTMAQHDGDWSKYEAALYAAFVADFVSSKPIFRGVKLGLKRHPLSQGKEATYWHFTSEGSVEADRVPDLRRCERIRWPRPGIDNSTEPNVKVWNTERRGERRITIWLEREDYVIVLADSGSYLLPWTAYCVERAHRREKLQREFEAFKKAAQKG